MIKSRKYRIVKDGFAGYEAQVWRWWFPFWTQIGFTNTHSTIEGAIEYIERWKPKRIKTIVVWRSS
jgi:hypothetical protein